MTTFKEAQNQAKQIKNAKRGGYTPTIAKDVNKHKVEKVKRLVQDLEKESAENMELWRDGADRPRRQATFEILQAWHMGNESQLLDALE